MQNTKLKCTANYGEEGMGFVIPQTELGRTMQRIARGGFP